MDGLEIAFAGATVAMSIGGSILVAMLKTEGRITRLEAQGENNRRDVERLLESLYRRGEVGAHGRGLGKMQSPLVVGAEAKGWFDPIAKNLRTVYRELRALDPQVSDPRVALKIEERHGEWIIKNVCIPKSISTFECWPLAVAVAKETSILDTPGP